MEDNGKPIANPYVVLREEFDDWAVLFNPDDDCGFGLSPAGVYVWKLLDGRHSIDDVFEEIRKHAVGVPEGAREHIRAFVEELVTQGLAALGDSGSYGGKSVRTVATVNHVGPFPYEPPNLVNLNSGSRVLGATCNKGSSAGCCSATGNVATGSPGKCYNGTSGTYPSNCTCDPGTCGYFDNGTCNCYGACVDGSCNGGSDGSIFCYTGGCAYYHICNNGSGLQI